MYSNRCVYVCVRERKRGRERERDHTVTLGDADSLFTGEQG